MATQEITTTGRTRAAAHRPSEYVETVIVGGGQAGLATAYHLAEKGRECVVLDANERIGDSWRKRWPSLRLYSPARYDALPGMRFPAARHSFPTGHEMADYLAAYAQRFQLRIRSGIKVERLTRDKDRYVIEAGDRRIEAANVVVATGVMQRPVIPPFAAELDPEIRQLHSNDYRSPAQLREGPVLVVGAAHSGADIAFEVAPEHETILVGRATGEIPTRLESRVTRFIFPVLRFLATRVLTANTPLGRKVGPELRAHGGPLLRVKSADLEAAGVEWLRQRMVGAQDGMPVVEDGRVLRVSNVIWCTGFRNDFDWIELPVFGEDGFPRQRRGIVEESPGLYFVGLVFLHSFSSMLILGAGRDGGYVARQIASRRVAREVRQGG
jgi:putative flavoprotein involved in K+ transport